MLDLSLLKNLMGGDEILVQRFINIFREQSQQQISELNMLVETEDWETLSNTVHSLKTQCNYMGLSVFGEQLRQIEEYIDRADTDVVPVMLADFQIKFSCFMKEEFET